MQRCNHLLHIHLYMAHGHILHLFRREQDIDDVVVPICHLLLAAHVVHHGQQCVSRLGQKRFAAIQQCLCQLLAVAVGIAREVGHGALHVAAHHLAVIGQLSPRHQVHDAPQVVGLRPHHGQ